MKKSWLIRSLAILLVFCSLVSFVWADESEDKNFLFGTFAEHTDFLPELPPEDRMLTDSFYYSDDWFLEDPSVRNDALALISMQLIDSMEEGELGGYGAVLLSKLGFEEIGCNGFLTENPDDLAYTWARKSLDDCILVVIRVQSYALDLFTKTKGWKQNFTINGEDAKGEHYAYAKAVGLMIDGIAELGKGEKVKYWITGQSRGGGLANLISAKLPDLLGSSNAGIYAYTFEAPATVDPDYITDPEKYNYIHNYVCSDDVVTRIPMWGMTRYGNLYELKTPETDAGLEAELKKLGSKAAEKKIVPYDDMPLLIETLEARVSAAPGDLGDRSDYSRLRTESFTSAEGEVITVDYSYQESLVHLIGLIYSGNLRETSSTEDSAFLDRLISPVFALADAVHLENQGRYEESAPYYWKAAQGFHPIYAELVPNGADYLSETDFFALLRLLGPIIIDIEYERTDDPESDVVSYLTPLLNIVDGAASMVYSHHFDTIIARLKTLAPQPDLDSIDLPVEEPCAEDAASKAPEEVKDFISSLNQDWLSVDAAWDTSDTVLADSSMYYLDVNLHAIGHLVPEDFTFTIQGKAPIDEPAVAYKDGASEIHAVWEFAVNAPDFVQILFDEDSISPIEVPRGQCLKYIEAPVPFSEDASLQFTGWHLDDGTPWEEIFTVADETHVSASWIHRIDNIRIDFALPSSGETFAAPTVPADALYFISESHVFNENWEEVTAADAGNYELCLYVRGAEDHAEFVFDAPDVDDPDWLVYDGKATVNGAAVKAEYLIDEGSPYLVIYYPFTVSAPSESIEEPVESVPERPVWPWIAAGVAVVVLVLLVLVWKFRRNAR